MRTWECRLVDEKLNGIHLFGWWCSVNTFLAERINWNKYVRVRFRMVAVRFFDGRSVGRPVARFILYIFEYICTATLGAIVYCSLCCVLCRVWGAASQCQFVCSIYLFQLKIVHTHLATDRLSSANPHRQTHRYTTLHTHTRIKQTMDKHNTTRKSARISTTHIRDRHSCPRTN